ncbi:MAG: sigma-70 family RNA polymerase sigma factor [Armatimonadetes bacterium]|nr:sigma-70 family RNA polymerase sigma factor [Armatimonadota bacterium]
MMDDLPTVVAEPAAEGASTVRSRVSASAPEVECPVAGGAPALRETGSRRSGGTPALREMHAHRPGGASASREGDTRRPRFRRAGLAPPEFDPLDLQLTIAAHAPLLTAGQEITLAKRVEQGDSAARETLVNSNIRLVASVARRYMGRGLPLEDMMQEGLIGLMRAIDKYNYMRGYRFSTYATHWIRQAISRAVANQGRCIRLPAHVVDALSRLGRATEKLRQRLGRSPTRQELAEETGISDARIGEMIEWAALPLSLENPVGAEGDSLLADFVPAPEETGPADRAFRAAVREELIGALSVLSPKERAVITLRFGLNDDEPRTLLETGRNLCITRERARQIEGQALAKLRHTRAAARAADALA